MDVGVDGRRARDQAIIPSKHGIWINRALASKLSRTAGAKKDSEIEITQLITLVHLGG